MVNEDVLKKTKQWRGYVQAKLGFRNHWYPIFFSSEVKEGKPVSTKLLGENVLINRIDGGVFVIKDRCLHRGVPLSKKLESYTKDTITCWYHAWTYQWKDGLLCDILTDPGSRRVGKFKLKTYAAQEAKGLIFVFMGDIDPPPLSHDVPPNFLDDNMAIHGIKTKVNSNWRMGAENGFDSTHVFLHKDSQMMPGNETVVPLGFSPNRGEENKMITLVKSDEGPTGVFDNLSAHSRPIFEGTIQGEPVVHSVMGGDKRIALQISIWLPGALKVDPFPDPSLIQFEWYVPRDETSHWYFRTLGKRVENPVEEAAYEKEFHEHWKPLSLHGFNDDDIWAREAMQTFYEDDWGWVNEQLFEADRNIIAWRKLASEMNRGIQSPSDL